MKKISKLKLNQLSKWEVEQRALNSSRGGEGSCDCSCCCASKNEEASTGCDFSRHDCFRFNGGDGARVTAAEIVGKSIDFLRLNP